MKQLNKEQLQESIDNLTKLGLSIFFILSVLTYSFIINEGIPNNIFLAIASLIGAYMAMNIGANDVANNVGPAVGSKAITLIGAVIIAAIFEASGAIFAGGDVVNTIKKGIIDIDAFHGDTDPFIWAMISALLSSALWLNFATMMKVPVSTTHSIVGGVLGAGIAAVGFSVVDWNMIIQIIISWIVSPLFGGVISAIFLFSIKKSILFKEDKIGSAQKYLPFFIGLTSWAFITYLLIKGLKNIWPNILDFLNNLPFITIQLTDKPSLFFSSLVAFTISSVVYIIVKKRLSLVDMQLENTKESVNNLFTIPLIFSAALLSFAHGANDVANAIGPLAAINDAIINGDISNQATVPLWIMSIGALGIALGLALYGPRLIKTVGSEITELDQIRAFSIAMSASITVIIASQLGLPVSSTHITIGAVFGVGFLREYIHIEKEISLTDEKKELNTHKKELLKLQIKKDKTERDIQNINLLSEIIVDEKKIISSLKKEIKKGKNIEYVKRDTIKKIVSAWIITVPSSAILSAILFFMIKGIVL